MKWIQKSIRSKIVMTVFACIIVFAAIACPSILITISSVHERSIDARAQSISRGSLALVEDKADAVRRGLENLAAQPQVAELLKAGDMAGLESLLKFSAESYGVDFLAAADSSLKVVASSTEGFDSVAASAIASTAASGETAFGAELVSPSLAAAAAAVPVNIPDLGSYVLFGGYDLASPEFTARMNSVYQVDSGVYLAGGLISSAPLKETVFPGEKLAEDITAQTAQGGPVILRQSFGANRVQSVYTPVADKQGSVVAVLYNGIDRTAEDRTVTIFIILLLAGICVLCVIALWMIDLVVKGVSQRVNRMVGYAQEISSGDMSSSISIKGNDEVAKLGAAFAEMTSGLKKQVDVVEIMAQGDFSVSVPVRGEKDVMGKSLQEMAGSVSGIINSISLATQQVTQGSRQISSGAQNLAHASQQQAHDVEALSVSIHNISGLIEDNEQKMQHAAQLTLDIQGMAREGTEKMSHMTAAVTDIDHSSGEIRKIMNVIEDIAFQTNILALNASVEAARAGEYGKGFAVVADEVRSLAEKSSTAAQNTSKLITDTVGKAKIGTEIANETAAYFGRIVDGVETSSGIISQATQQAKSQAELISEINSGIANVSAVVQQNAATAQQSAASSQHMIGQASQLEHTVSRFKRLNQSGNSKLLNP